MGELVKSEKVTTREQGLDASSICSKISLYDDIQKGARALEHILTFLIQPTSCPL